MNSQRNKYCTYGSLHAEADLLRKMKFPKKKTMDLLVIRVTRSGKITMSKPCYHCLLKMANHKWVDIRNVYYSESNGIIRCVKLTQLLKEPFHISKGFQ